jgi:hypothetical protein
MNDPNDNLKSELIYGAQCKSCVSDYVYVGETSRFLTQRSYSHLHDRTSPIRNHMDTTGHRAIDFKIIKHQSKPYPRKVLEKLLIEKFDPPLNTKANLDIFLNIDYNKLL